MICCLGPTGVCELPVTFTGVREFIELLRGEDELACVREQVGLDQEIGAVCVKGLGGRGPAFFSERPGNPPTPFPATLLAPRRRFALPPGCSVQETHREWNRRAEHPLLPVE